MNIHYPHFMGGSQKCTQGTPLVKARNGKKMKMLNLKFAWISDPAANSRQTAVADKWDNKGRPKKNCSDASCPLEILGGRRGFLIQNL